MKPVFALRMLLFQFVILFGLTFCGCGCNTLKDEARATGKTLVDCTRATALQAIVEYGPTVEQVILDSVAGDGKVDVDRVKSVAKSYASDAARCVLAATVARLTSPPAPSSPDAPHAEPLALDRAALAAAWTDIRTTQFGGATFKLAEP